MSLELELWTVPLRPCGDDLALLDERERARAARLAIPHKRNQFVAAQAALRRVLGARLGREAAGIQFAYGRWGKPALREPDGLAFNLTHSDDLALVALGEGTEIGVDVEDTRRARPFRRLASRYFAASEGNWIASLGEDEVRGGFYRAWTLKEAYLKAIGTGLSVAPERFSLDLRVCPARLVAAPPEFADAGPWTFAEPAVGSDFAAAVCWRGDARPLRVRSSAELGDEGLS